MAIELDVCIQAPFSFAELRRAAREVLAEAGHREAERLVVIDSVHAYARRGHDAGDATDDALQAACGAGLGGDHVVFALPGGAAQVLFAERGSSGERDAGPALAVATIQDDQAVADLVALAVALAASRLTGKPVRDVEGTLGGRAPAEVLAELVAAAETPA
jgi:hypothetical protein